MANIQLQFRRGTSTEWTANGTVVLASGEMGIETDTAKFKIGDGTTTWNSLPYGGIQGYTGSQGPAGGYTGSQGNIGYTGSLGYTGSASTVGGYTGSQGDIGYSGSRGYSGSQGTTGYTGSSGDKYQTVSTTSFTLGTSGNQTITVGTGLNFSTGQSISIAYDVNNIQYADVSSYTSGSGSLVFQKTAIKGSGTYAVWTINLDGAVGALGYAGSKGDTGYTGSTSTTPGYTGSAGYTGSQGDIGYTGSAATGTITFSSNTMSGASNTDIKISPNGTGKIDADTHRIINVTDPSSSQDAATKNYVDTATSGTATSGFSLAMAIAL